MPLIQVGEPFTFVLTICATALGTTAVGAYSPRALLGFPIAASVTWQEVEQGIKPSAYTIEHPFRRRG